MCCARQAVGLWRGLRGSGVDDSGSRKGLRDPSGERLKIADLAEAEEHRQTQLDRYDQGEWRLDHEENQAQQDPHAKGLHQQRSIEDHSPRCLELANNLAELGHTIEPRSEER